MDGSLTIGELIKRFVKLRGRTMKEVAADLAVNYTTLNGIINRNALDAKLLFELANLLDIDLNWMSQMFDHHHPISYLERHQMPRMQSEFREHELPTVYKALDDCIRNNPNSLAEARHELLRHFNQAFYLLDVLLPEDYIILITVDRKCEKYLCLSMTANTGGRGRTVTGRPAVVEGHEMINRLIANRKEEIS